MDVHVCPDFIMMKCDSTSDHDHHPEGNGVHDTGGGVVGDRDVETEAEEGLTADSALNAGR